MYDWPGKRWGISLSNDYDHLLRFAVTLNNAGNRREAQTVYQKAITMMPSRLMPYAYVPDSIHVFDAKKMTAFYHLMLSDVAKDEARVGKPSEAEKNLAKRLQEARLAVSIAPNYAPAYLMLAEALEYQSQRESVRKQPGGGEVAKREAAQAYRRAATLGTGDTRAAAQKGLGGYWFADLGTAPR